ncbi:hypothetical protein SGLAM104S_04200 [Streptomyces glaucescens]
MWRSGLLLLIWLPWWAALLIVLGVPAAAYLALDPAQRRRLRRAARKEIGRLPTGRAPDGVAGAGLRRRSAAAPAA